MDVDNANCKVHVSQCADMDLLSVERPLKIDKVITGLDVLVAELHRVFSHDHVNVQDVQKLMAGYKSDPKDWKKYAKFDRFRYTRNLVDAGNGLFNIIILCWGPGHASAIHDHADSHCFMKILSGNLEEVRYDWPEGVEPEVIKKLKSNNKPTCPESEVTKELTNLNLSCQNDCQDDSCQNVTGKTDSTQNRKHETGENEKEQTGKHENTENQSESQKENEEECYDIKNMEEVGRTRLEENDVCYINDALGLHRMENPSHVDGAVSLHLYCPPFDSCRVFDARTGKPTEVPVTFWSMYGKKVKRVIEANSIADSQ